MRSDRKQIVPIKSSGLMATDGCIEVVIPVKAISIRLDADSIDSENNLILPVVKEGKDTVILSIPIQLLATRDNLDITIEIPKKKKES